MTRLAKVSTGHKWPAKPPHIKRLTATLPDMGHLCPPT